MRKNTSSIDFICSSVSPVLNSSYNLPGFEKNTIM